MQIDRCDVNGKHKTKGDYMLYKFSNKQEWMILCALGSVDKFKESSRFTYYLTNKHDFPNSFSEAIQLISKYNVKTC